MDSQYGISSWTPRKLPWHQGRTWHKQQLQESWGSKYLVLVFCPCHSTPQQVKCSTAALRRGNFLPLGTEIHSTWAITLCPLHFCLWTYMGNETFPALWKLSSRWHIRPVAEGEKSAPLCEVPWKEGRNLHFIWRHPLLPQVPGMLSLSLVSISPKASPAYFITF